MSDETKVYEVFTTQENLDGLPLGYAGRMWRKNVGGTAPIRCALIPIGDGLLPGTRVRTNRDEVAVVAGPSLLHDGMVLVEHEVEPGQFCKNEAWAAMSLTPIPDEPRTFTEEQVREALFGTVDKAGDHWASTVLARLREVER